MTLDEFRQFWLLLIATDTRIESLDPMQEAAAGTVNALNPNTPPPTQIPTTTNYYALN